LVVGGASGMGAAAAELLLDAGAEVVVMDRAAVTLPGVQPVHVDLAERGSVDAALEEAGGPFDALLCCAGVADGTPASSASTSSPTATSSTGCSIGTPCPGAAPSA